MSTDIAPIKGLIELQDDFTSQLGLARAALSNFSKENQESLKAVAGAAGLVGTAIGAIAVATLELGKRGSEVNDLRQTIEHFAGGADQANDVMQKLRAGTKGTVDDFALANQAAHLLSAGVKLTADDFGTLGSAAFVLQNRGLGPTKEQLDLVSDALVTGRTRALAAALGVVDITDAQEAYAKQLGVTKDDLNEAGKAEANRIAVMQLLKNAVKDAGQQERDFGEELEAGRAQLSNWVDDLASSVAASKVFKAGFEGIEAGIKQAFGGDSSKSIQTVTKLIEDGAIGAATFGQVVIGMTKAVEVAWNGVRTVVLGVETGILALVTTVVAGVSEITKAAADLHIISPEAAQGVEDLKINLDGMTQSLKDQTVEAAKSVFGHTEFDTTLDKLSDTLAKTKAAMLAAQAATDKQTATTNEATKAVASATTGQNAFNQSMVDTEKIQQRLDKSTKELNEIWSQYYGMVTRDSGTSRDAQIADINATFQKQVDALDKLDPLYKQKYAAYQAIADESLKAIEVDWDSVKDKSIEGLQEQADKALATYQAMSTSALTFSRQALQEQYQKYLDLEDQVRGYGRAVTDATAEAVQGVQLLDHAWVTDADIAATEINKTTVMVRTLSGELISLQEAQERQQAGGTFTSPAIDQYTIDTTPGGADALLRELSNLGQNLETERKGITDARSQNQYFQDVARFNALRDSYNLLISEAKNKNNLPHAANGGMLMVGEEGPELVSLPYGSQVYPTGTGPSGVGGSSFQNTFNIKSTNPKQAAKEVSDVIMRQLKSMHQFPAA